MGEDVRQDFLGAFAVVRRGEHVLFVANDRRIGGRGVRVWDLPGGAVESGERVPEALARELREETGLVLVGTPQFLFVQEGERRFAGRRAYAWRSFFFAVEVEPGEPVASGEVHGVRWLDRAAMSRELQAPYHDSFRAWLQHGGSWFASAWDD
jgi:8-oxo-dGTP diphosphatase